MKRPIGVFDSGIGGLTVVHELIKHLPHEQIVYFGDTARVPYGGKSTEAIQGFADEITGFLLSKDVKLVVVACNTASATSLEWLRTRYSIPIE
jgi:glutamate racemase